MGARQNCCPDCDRPAAPLTGRIRCHGCEGDKRGKDLFLQTKSTCHVNSKLALLLI